MIGLSFILQNNSCPLPPPDRDFIPVRAFLQLKSFYFKFKIPRDRHRAVHWAEGCKTSQWLRLGGKHSRQRHKVKSAAARLLTP